jgi:hypothetical protein
MGGITSMTGYPSVLNRFYDGEALGLVHDRECRLHA